MPASPEVSGMLLRGGHAAKRRYVTAPKHVNAARILRSGRVRQFNYITKGCGASIARYAPGREVDLGAEALGMEFGVHVAAVVAQRDVQEPGAEAAARRGAHGRSADLGPAQA